MAGRKSRPKNTAHQVGDLLLLAALPGEPEDRLDDFIASRTAEFVPRNSAERHFVHQLILAEWTRLRVLAMSRAVHEHIAVTPSSVPTPAETGDNPLAIFAHYAYALARAPFGPVLAVLTRLEITATRCYDAGIRRLVALRRCGPDLFPAASAPLHERFTLNPLAVASLQNINSNHINPKNTTPGEIK